MNSNQQLAAIATNSSNYEDIANQIAPRNRRRILDALADGSDYLQMKKRRCIIKGGI